LYEGGVGNAAKDRITEKYGDAVGNYHFDKDKIEGGLNRNRGCTDIICAVIFLAFLGSLGYLTYYSYHNGDVNRILAPVYYDKDGAPKLCGAESDF
jgi:hypothetical protein